MENGFHGIESLFQAVGLQDRIVIRSLKTTGIEVTGDFDCDPENTTVFRAAHSFLQRTGWVARGLSIQVEKRIPSQAGLGGGSADAAAVLRALNELFGSPLAIADLAGLGAGTGSDVPFFLGGGAAVVSGRGEIVEGIPSRTDLGFLIVKPSFGSPTAAAFRTLDEARAVAGNPASPKSPPLRGIGGLEERYRGDPRKWGFFNSFQEVLDCSHPEYRETRRILGVYGALHSQLTGSGSSVFGVFPSREAACEVCRLVSAALAESGFVSLAAASVYAAGPLASPLVLD